MRFNYEQPVTLRWLMRLCMGGLSVLLMVSSVNAQVRFSQPTRMADVANYTTIEECKALLDRVQDSIRNRTPMTVDTFPLVVSQSLRRKPMPAAFVTMARGCADRFFTGRIVPEEFELFAPLLLRADRDADVETLATRILAAEKPFTGSETDRTRLNVLESIVRMYTDAYPPRYAAGVRLLTTELQHAGTAGNARFWLLAEAARLSEAMEDTASLRQFVAQARADYQRMTAQGNDRSTEVIWNGMYPIVGRLMQQELLDSLQRSIPAYLALRTSDPRFQEPQHDDGSATIGRVGDQVTPVHGDFWFTPRDTVVATGLVRPAPGKTTLIVFLSSACRGNADRIIEWSRYIGREPCFGAYAMLKRVMQRFPIDLILVTQTTGAIWPAAPMESETEARFYRDWWLGFHQIPATLAVAKTPFWRIEAPDGRRVNDPVPNQSNYLMQDRAAVLVDRTGLILERFPHLTREDEPWLGQLLNILEHPTAAVPAPNR